MGSDEDGKDPTLCFHEIRDAKGGIIFSTWGEPNLPLANVTSATPELLEVTEDLESWNAQSTASTAADVLAELGPILMKARAAIEKATKG
jgi:hypothetical protein